eukprot:sb/3466390/
MQRQIREDKRSNMLSGTLKYEPVFYTLIRREVCFWHQNYHYQKEFFAGTEILLKYFLGTGVLSSIVRSDPDLPGCLKVEGKDFILPVNRGARYIGVRLYTQQDIVYQSYWRMDMLVPNFVFTVGPRFTGMLEGKDFGYAKGGDTLKLGVLVHISTSRSARELWSEHNWPDRDTLKFEPLRNGLETFHGCHFVDNGQFMGGLGRTFKLYLQPFSPQNRTFYHFLPPITWPLSTKWHPLKVSKPFQSGYSHMAKNGYPINSLTRPDRNLIFAPTPTNARTLITLVPSVKRGEPDFARLPPKISRSWQELQGLKCFFGFLSKKFHDLILSTFFWVQPNACKDPK